ncbi:alpha/beta fold hydrolase [Micromonospora sp. NPDC049645]|uniref:alpha/beta fold hydrolase n=1 Tax=Micromonospora sp. NPDC049645 TaxID=3155508 RepID=UPI0034243E51
MAFSGTVRHGGGTIAYGCAGAGAPVVFIHGFGLDRRMWTPQVADLAATHRVVRYDCRGFGRSSCPVGPYNHADDLRVLLDRLGVVQPHLVGSSMGGRVALAYAARWPTEVASLVLLGTDVGGYRFRIGWDVRLGPGGLDGARADWLRHPIFATARTDPVVWALIRQMVAAYSGWHWQHEDVREPTDADTVNRLADIRTPTTVVVGERDLPDFHRIARLLVRRLPRARAVTVPRAGHLVNLEAADACAGIVRRHLETLSSTG